MNRRTGRPLSSTYLTSLRRILTVLQNYAAASQTPLTIPAKPSVVAG